jgi:hypothetical protein
MAKDTFYLHESTIKKIYEIAKVEKGKSFELLNRFDYIYH